MENLNLQPEALSNYRDTLTASAFKSLNTIMPEKIQKLSKILEQDLFSLPTVQHDLHAKKRPRSNSLDSSEKISQMFSILQAEIIELLETTNSVKVWVQMNVPKMEDGNNFGVSVQEEILQEFNRSEEACFSLLDVVIKYYTSRGKLTSKMHKYPQNVDYRNAITQLDLKQVASCRFYLVDLNNNYAVLLDMVLKNIEKLVKPRSVNSNSIQKQIPSHRKTLGTTRTSIGFALGNFDGRRDTLQAPMLSRRESVKTSLATSLMDRPGINLTGRPSVNFSSRPSVSLMGRPSVSFASRPSVSFASRPSVSFSNRPLTSQKNSTNLLSMSRFEPRKSIGFQYSSDSNVAEIELKMNFKKEVAPVRKQIGIESKKTVEFKKPDSKKIEFKKPIGIEVKKTKKEVEFKKPELKKTDFKIPESKKTNLKKPEPKKTMLKKPEPKKTEFKKPEPKKTEFKKPIEPKKVELKKPMQRISSIGSKIQSNPKANPGSSIQRTAPKTNQANSAVIPSMKSSSIQRPSFAQSLNRNQKSVLNPRSTNQILNTENQSANSKSSTLPTSTPSKGILKTSAAPLSSKKVSFQRSPLKSIENSNILEKSKHSSLENSNILEKSRQLIAHFAKDGLITKICHELDDLDLLERQLEQDIARRIKF